MRPNSDGCHQVNTCQSIFSRKRSAGFLNLLRRAYTYEKTRSPSARPGCGWLKKKIKKENKKIYKKMEYTCSSDQEFAPAKNPRIFTFNAFVFYGWCQQPNIFLGHEKVTRGCTKDAQMEPLGWDQGSLQNKMYKYKYSGDSTPTCSTPCKIRGFTHKNWSLD